MLWVSFWHSGEVGAYDPAAKTWKTWLLPSNPGSGCYSVYVDEQDKVWLTDFMTNAIVRFDPKTEKFESFPSSQRGAQVRQMLGRPGEAWGAESGNSRLVADPLLTLAGSAGLACGREMLHLPRHDAGNHPPPFSAARCRPAAASPQRAVPHCRATKPLIGRLIREARARPRISQRMDFISRALLGIRYQANTLIGSSAAAGGVRRARRCIRLRHLLRGRAGRRDGTRLPDL